MNTDVILFWLEIAILNVAIILIFFSLFKQTMLQEVLSSISGGSQRLFSHQKVKLASSLLTIILICLSLLLFSLAITIRIIINVAS